MEFDLIHMWQSMNLLVRTVVVVLSVQALGCIAVCVDRMLLLFMSKRRSKKFAKEAGPLLARSDYEEALKIAKSHSGSHLATYIQTGLSVFLDRRSQGHDREKSADLAQRALDRKGEAVSKNLHRGMNILASTGSTAPFIGLLGTVLGILNAFKMIGDEGSGGISAIGPAIAEALVVTGFGLMVAIPAVLLFNYLSTRITNYEGGLANAGGELIDQLESGVSTERQESSAGLESSPAPAKSIPDNRQTAAA